MVGTDGGSQCSHLLRREKNELEKTAGILLLVYHNLQVVVIHMAGIGPFPPPGHALNVPREDDAQARDRL